MKYFYLVCLISMLIESGVYSFDAFVSNHCYSSKKRLRHSAIIAFASNKVDQSPSWGIGDDWDNLSSNDNTSYDGSLSFFTDPAGEVAKSIEAEINKGDFLESKEDQFISEAVETIQGGVLDPNGPALYDTKRGFDAYSKSVHFLDDLGTEIGLLVRCNESPDDLLISEGRALPPLTDDQKYDVKQLVEMDEINKSENGQYKPTLFFVNAIQTMFQSHATTNGGKEEPVMKAEEIAKWMSQSLNEAVGRHDKRVTVTISRFGTHGSGVLTEKEFINLYMEAVINSMDWHQTRKVGAAMKKMRMEAPTQKSVWRDLENHGFFPPIIEERKKLQEEIDIKVGLAVQDTNKMDTIMDECEILELGDDEHSAPRASSMSQMVGATASTKKSSHEFVELASDNKTPRRLRDGDFVFIDEESCIGCNQCANIAPSSFQMEDSGRARTHFQSNAPEVPIAVSACPVSCMHNVAFHELKEFETARDVGDGRSDHRHMGRKNGYTPLNVSRTGSDMNHKSSWYHYLKQKCFLSKSCPQRGCYDCPKFNKAGDNPYFQKIHRASEKVRASDIMKSGEADAWRKTAEL